MTRDLALWARGRPVLLVHLRRPATEQHPLAVHVDGQRQVEFFHDPVTRVVAHAAEGTVGHSPSGLRAVHLHQRPEKHPSGYHPD